MSNSNQKIFILIWLNAILAIGMSTSVFTGQLKVELDNAFYPLAFPASNIFFSFLTFPVTDVIADVFGRKHARNTVMVGFVSQFLTISIIQICLLFPGETEALERFAFGGVKVFLGSTVAYFISQFWDIWIFHLIKEKVTGEKHLWFRNNVSTFTSQAINSSLFILIVFGTTNFFNLLLGSIIVKWTIALIDTPFVYLLRHYIKKSIEEPKLR